MMTPGILVKSFSIPDDATMLELGAKLAHACPPSCIVFFTGELGAGKTTLIRGFLRGFGYQRVVKSPTYTLVETYVINKQRIFHFDFYRLQSPHELEQIGIADYMHDAICLIEWPERGRALLPMPDLNCEIAVVPNGREIMFTALSAQGEKILAKM